MPSPEIAIPAVHADPTEVFRLDDRVALITGASSGLGARFAEVLSSAGAKVVLAARRADRLQELASRIPDATIAPIDLSSAGAPERLVETALEQCGRVDVLVNNAGITDTSPALEEPIERFREVLEINLVVPFLLARRAAAAMIDQGGGSIVNIASVNGLLASRGWPETSYSASKGGIVNLTRELANQWAAQGVRVNAIGPGYFETEMTTKLFDNDDGRRFIQRNTPMRRPGQVNELDGAMLFLASPASSYVTGQTLLVDGGWSII